MRYGMLIDLSLCASCGACALACKAENNTRNRAAGQSFNWADFIQKTQGRFPNTTQTVIPVMCNHCENPACVKACPTGAMYITPEGVVMHSDEACIGCRRCQKACPYSSLELGEESLEGATYSVISFNPKDVDPRGDAIGRPEMIPGCSGSAREIERKLGVVPGYFNAFEQGDVASQRKDGVVEKCTMCYHRITNGQNPACVDACPARCRIFGDLDDPNSEIATRLKGEKPMRLKEEKGTRPKVFYIGRFSAR